MKKKLLALLLAVTIIFQNSTIYASDDIIMLDEDNSTSENSEDGLEITFNDEYFMGNEIIVDDNESMEEIQFYSEINDAEKDEFTETENKYELIDDLEELGEEQSSESEQLAEVELDGAENDKFTEMGNEYELIDDLEELDEEQLSESEQPAENEFYASGSYGTVLESGNCGETDEDELMWTVYDNNDDGSADILAISGEGAMKDYSILFSAPWRKYVSSDSLKCSLILENGITRIGDLAFSFCRSLTGNLVIPESVTSIGYKAFYTCKYLSGDLIIPNSVVCIEDNAFYDCTSFRGNIVISENVTNIGNSAFESCFGLTGNLVIPESVAKIGEAAFRGCSSLTGDLIIPRNVINIETRAFESCRGFTGLMISDGVVSIGAYAFCGCSGFTGNLTIPDSVESIGAYAFSECSGFTGDLAIPDSVESIGAYAFERCRNMTGNLVIPESVTSIGQSAFYYCSGLTGDLIIPASITNIEDFVFYGCNGMTGNLVIPESVTSIGRLAFSGCSGLTGDLIIPESVTSIGQNAFSNCSGMTGNLVIPESVTIIESGAFHSCSGLTGNLIIPASITNIESSVFDGCSGMTGNLVIPESVTSIGQGAFGGCTGLTGDLIIPESVMNIGAYAFAYCIGFTGDLNIPDRVISIENNAFTDCGGLTGLILPAGVTYIGSSAFSGCNGFCDIYFWGNAPEILNDVFKSITATAYYPQDDSTWTKEVMQDYGGTITWLPWSPEVENNNIKFIALTDRITRNYSGKVTLPVAVELLDGGNVPDGTAVSYSLDGKNQRVTVNDGVILIPINNMSGISNITKLSAGNKYSTVNTSVSVTVDTTKLKFSESFDVDLKIEVAPEISKLIGLDGSVASGIGIQVDMDEDALNGAESDETTFSMTKTSSLAGNISTDLSASLNSGSEKNSSIVSSFKNKISSKYNKEGKETSKIEIKDFDTTLNNNEQQAAIGYFMLESLTGRCGEVTKAELLKLYYDIYGEYVSKYETSEQTASASVSVSENSTITGKIGDLTENSDSSNLSFCLTATGGNTKYSTSVNHNLNTLEVTYLASAELADRNIILDGNWLFGLKGSIYGTNLSKNTAEISAKTKSSGEIIEVSASSKNKQYDAIAGTSCAVEKKSEVSFGGNDAQDIVNRNPALAQLASGAANFLSLSQIGSVYENMYESNAVGKYGETLTYKDSIDFEKEVGIITGGVSGSNDYEFNTNQGIVYNGNLFLTVDNESFFPSGITMELGYSVPDILEVSLKGLSTFLGDAVKYKAGKVADSIKEGAAELWSKITSPWYATVSIVGHNNTRSNEISVNGISGYSLNELMTLAVTDEINDTSINTTMISDAYTVMIYTDESQSELVTDTQLVEYPVQLTLSYTNEDLQNVGISSDDAKHIGVCHWNSDKQIYQFINEYEVDTAAMTVTLNVPESGEYLLVLDRSAPKVSKFTVSNKTAYPVITAAIKETCGISSGSLAVDGNVIVSKTEFNNYYDDRTGMFSFEIVEGLSDGKHTASIMLTDTFGNEMETEKSISWTVDSTGPIISAVDIARIVTKGDELLISANVIDTDLLYVMAKITNSGITSFRHLSLAEDSNETWRIKVSTSTYDKKIQVCLIAIDDAGNQTLSDINEIQIHDAESEHEWDNGVVVKAATCVATGAKTYTCTVCGVTKSETIAVLGHNLMHYTATANNIEYWNCNRCGKNFSDSTGTQQISSIASTTPSESETPSELETPNRPETPSTPIIPGELPTVPGIHIHSWGAWIVTAAATVFEAEQQKRTCSVCNESETRSNGSKLAPTISLNASSLKMKKGQSTRAFKVDGLANGDTVKSVISNKTKVLKVLSYSANGTIKLKAQKRIGTAKLIITLASGRSKTITVKVQSGTVKTTKVKVNTKKVTLKKGAKTSLVTIITPITSQQKVSYKTSNRRVATVNSKGLITAKKAGTAKITVKSGSKKVTVTVKVTK